MLCSFMSFLIVAFPGHTHLLFDYFVYFFTCYVACHKNPIHPFHTLEFIGGLLNEFSHFLIKPPCLLSMFVIKNLFWLFITIKKRDFHLHPLYGGSCLIMVLWSGAFSRLAIIH